MSKLLLIIFFLFSQIQAIEIKELLSVYSGDIIYVNLKCNEPIFCNNIGIRLQGVYVPDINSANKKERRLGESARRYLEAILSGVTYYELRSVSRGECFMILAEIMVDGVSLSEIMISSGYAKDYD